MNKILKRITAMAMTMAVFVSSMLPTLASAAAPDGTNAKIKNLTTLGNLSSNTLGVTMVQKITITDDGKDYVSFCIDPGTPAHAGDSYSCYPGGSLSDPDHPLNYWLHTLNEDQQLWIGRTLYYGYYGKGHQTDAYLVATQLICWEIAGKNVPGKTVEPVRKFDDTAFTTTCSDSLLQHYTAVSGGPSKSSVTTAYNNIVNSVRKHEQRPSGVENFKFSAEDNPLTLKWNDTNKRYEVTIQRGTALWNDMGATAAIKNAGFGVTVTKVDDDYSKYTIYTTKPFSGTKTTDVMYKSSANANSYLDINNAMIYGNTSRVGGQVIAIGGGKDPVYGYIAFETDSGGVTITKTAADANGKTYTATSTNNSALNKAVRFKIKAPNGEYVNATKGGNGQYTFTQYATGATFALNSDGKFSVSGLPNGTYTLVETATATGYTKAADKKFTVSDNNPSVSVSNSQDYGTLTVEKQLNEGGTKKKVTEYSYTNAAGKVLTWTQLRSAIRFQVMDTATKKYVTVKRLGGSASGHYEYVGETTDSSSTSSILCFGYYDAASGYPRTDGGDASYDMTAGTMRIDKLPTGSYTIIEIQRDGYSFKDYGVTGSANVAATITKGATTKKTVTNKITTNGELIINKVISLSDHSEATDDMYGEVSFLVKNSSGYLTLTSVDTADGTYKYSGSGSSGTRVYLGTESHAASITELPAGRYTVEEYGSNAFQATSSSLDVTTDSTGDSTVTFYNTEKTGVVKVIKQTEEQKNIDGIEFVLSGTSESGRKINMTAETDKDGIATFESIPVGTYTLSENGETVNTDVYILPADESVTVLYDETSEKIIENVEKKGSVKVVKHTEGQKNIEGIEFTISGTSDSGREIKKTGSTNAAGELTFDEIPVGTYTVTENGETVKGSIYIPAEEQEVTVLYNETVTTDFTNNEKKGSVKVVKHTEGQKNISNIEFVLSGTSDSGREINVSGKTDADGELTFENVPVGTYTLSENGKTVNNDVYLTAASQEVTVLYNETVTKDFTNVEKKGSVKVVKHTEGQKNVEGIEFTLSGTSDSGRAISVSGKTNAAGELVLENVPVGTYTLSENSATVKGDIYIAAASQEVTVLYNETVTKDFTNVEKKGSVKVVKHTEGQKNIEGIEFTLSGTSDSGRAISVSGKTNAAGELVLENVPVGTYTLSENSATVKGDIYIAAASQEVTVLYNETVTKDFTNVEKKGSVKVVKHTEGQKNIDGIEFTLSGTSDSGRAISVSGKTNAAGELVLENVPVGTYTLAENSATVKGDIYIAAASQEVTVLYNETVTKDFTNIEKTGSIKVQKRTEGMLNLEGIEFVLSGTSDSGRAISMRSTTDKDGVATFVSIPVGSYTVTENGETVPYAYLVADEQTVTVAYGETTPVDFLNLEKYGEVTVQKRTEGMLNIKGIGFTLSGTSDTGRSIREYALTDAEGKAVFNVPIGTYTITEDGETVPYAYLVAEPQQVTVTYSEAVTADIFNIEKSGTLQVQKSTKGNKNLEGIKFILSGTSDSGREIYAEGITNAEGKADFYQTDAEGNPLLDAEGKTLGTLPIGTYTVTELGETVPFGYFVAEPQQVTVAYAESTETPVTNEEMPGTLVFTKSDVSDGKLIPNCKIAIYDEEGNEVVTGVTDENGKIEFTLPSGKYYYQEIEAPENYQIDNGKYEFVIEAGKITEAHMTDEKKPGTLVFTKSDVSDGKLIPNCKIAIYDEEGNEVVTGVTDENGKIEFTLPSGKYYYQEIEAPSGYLIDNGKYEFVIEAGKITQAHMTDERVPDEVPPTGSPVDDIGYGLAGVLGLVCIVMLMRRRSSAK